MADPKQAAGEHAATYVESGMTVGLGTGSTAEHFLRRLGERVRKEGLRVHGVATSLASEASAKRHGIPLASLEEVGEVDVTVDGADEIDGAFRMIKGGGGALLREKVVAQASRREVIVVGAAKVVAKLGSTFPLPVEIVPFAHAPVRKTLAKLGDVRLREADGVPYRTDNGHWILDVRFATGIDDPTELEASLHRIAGVVETGLFIGLAHRLVVGMDDGTVETRDAPRC